jgi:hypothetical protein
VVLGLALLPLRAEAQGERKLQVSFNQGNVTVIASNVTLRDILAEWTRQGGCQFINVEKLPATMLPPLTFENQPEAMVLDSLLRTFPGYILAPRRVGSVGASRFEAVLVVAASRPVAGPINSSVAPVAAPLVTAGSPDDEIPPVSAGQPGPAQTRPGAAPTVPSGPGVPASGVYVGPGGRAAGPGQPTAPPGTTGRGGGGGGR